MSIVDFAPAFAKLNLPSVEDYHKRKVALISGARPIHASAWSFITTKCRYHRTGWLVSVRLFSIDLSISLIASITALSCCYQKDMTCTASSVALRASTLAASTISTKINTNVSLSPTLHLPSPNISRPRSIQAALRRSKRQHQSRLYHCPSPTLRDLQPRRAIPRQGLL